MFELVLAYKIVDLLFATKIEEICKRSAASFKNAQNLDQLYLALAAKGNKLIVCDLVSAKREIESIAGIVRASNAKLIGYYPHVDKDTAMFAHSICVDYVVPRSAFQSKLISLLS